MISRLRGAIAAAVALVVVVLTLGRVRVDRTGRPGAPAEAEDPARVAAVLDSTPGADPSIRRRGR